MKLKTTDHPQLHQDSFLDLKDLNFDTIIKNFADTLPANVKLEGFVNNSPVSITKDEIQDWKHLNKSFRLSNAQFLSPLLEKFCREGQAKLQSVVTANLYFTPHSESQCFGFHSDAQNILAYQLMGKKEWSFLKKDGTFIKEISQTSSVLNSFNQGLLDHEMFSLTLESGTFLSFPYCLLHQAKNLDQEPSVHVTFSWEYPTVGGFSQFLLDHLVPESSSHFFKEISKDELKQNLDTLKKQLFLEYLKQFRDREEHRAIHGRKC